MVITLLVKEDNKLNNSRRLAGAFLFIGGLQWLILVIISETFFPNYSVKLNDLSDLASTVAPNISIVQPSAVLFNITMILLGLAVILSTFFIHLSYRRYLVTVFLGIFGLACMLVGIFPGDAGSIHGIVSLLAFVFGPFSAIVAFKVENAPLKYISIIMGVAALVPLVTRFAMGDSSPILSALGRGGEERMIAYPVIAWVIVFGGCLIGSVQREN
jgi:hypothetical membrane protein